MNKDDAYGRIEESANRLERCIITFRGIVRELDKALAALALEWHDNMD